MSLKKSYKKQQLTATLQHFPRVASVNDPLCFLADQGLQLQDDDQRPVGDESPVLVGGMDPAGNQMNLFKEQVAEDQDDDNGPRVGISVSRRSPLDKNFIRFGRFGPKLMPVDTLVDR